MVRISDFFHHFRESKDDTGRAKHKMKKPCRPHDAERDQTVIFDAKHFVDSNDAKNSDDSNDEKTKESEFKSSQKLSGTAVKPTVEELSLPDDFKPELAMAWYNKRAQIAKEDDRRRRQDEREKIMEEINKLEADIECGIDVDSGLYVSTVEGVIRKQDEPATSVVDQDVSTDNLRSRQDDNRRRPPHTQRNKHYQAWHISEQHDHSLFDDDSATHISGMSRASGVSKAQSEKTQITSNKVGRRAISNTGPYANIDIGRLPYINTKSATSSSSDGEHLTEDRATDILGDMNESTIVEEIESIPVDEEASSSASANTGVDYNDHQKTFRGIFTGSDCRQSRLLPVLILCNIGILVIIIVIFLATKMSGRPGNESAVKTQGDNANDVSRSPNVPSMTPFSLDPTTSSLFPSTNNIVFTNTQRSASPTITPSNFEIISILISASDQTSNDTFTFSKSEVVVGENDGGAFGATVTLSQTGSVMAIGVPESIVNGVESAGKVEVYHRRDTQWIQRGPVELLRGRNQHGSFGYGVSMNADGNILAVSEPSHNASGSDHFGTVQAYFFNESIGQYTVLGTSFSGMTALSGFGSSLQLSNSGRYMIVGAPLHSTGNTISQGTVVVYQYDTLLKDWVLLGSPLAGSLSFDMMGSSVAIYEEVNSNTLIVAASAPNNSTGGYVRVWKYNQQNGQWKQVGSDLGNDGALLNEQAFPSDLFGHALSFASTRNTNISNRSSINSGPFLAIGTPLRDNWKRGLDSMDMTTVYELRTTVGNMTSFPEERLVLVGEPILSSNKNNYETGYAVQLFQTSKDGDGLLLAVGAPGADEGRGSVRWYWYGINATDEPNMWNEMGTVLTGETAGDNYGCSISIIESPDGFNVAVGAKQASNGGNGYVSYFTVT